MGTVLTDADLAEIECRLTTALAVAPEPWVPALETRSGTGGSSAVLLGGGADDDNEMYFDVRLGRERLVSPDARLDAIVDFVGHAVTDISSLLAEVKRLRPSE
jgi:hypothetical protein